MEHFFETTETIGEGLGFGAFSSLHLIWLGFFLLFAISSCLLYRRSSEKNRKLMRRIFALLLVADEIFKMLCLISHGNYLPKYLPLHLCSVNIILIAVHAFRPTKTLDNFLYCCCIPAALAALLFPSWGSLPLQNFMHVHSFTVHILLAVYPLMLLTGGDIRPWLRYLPKVLLLLGVLAVVNVVVNGIFGTNFMFLSYAEPGSPLLLFEDLFGNHLIGYIFLIPAVLLVMYLPVLIWEKRSAAK